MSIRENRSDIPNHVWKSVLSNTYLQTWQWIILNKGITEIAMYPMLLEELRPKTVIELGALNGGSALWLADHLALFCIEGEVYSVDIDLSLLDATAKNHPRVSFLQGDCKNLEAVLPPEKLVELPHPWLVIDDVHINTMGVCEYFHTTGLQAGDYLISEDNNPSVWNFWGDQPWEEQEEMEKGSRKL